VKDSLKAQLQATLGMVPAFTWYAGPSGGLQFVNQRCADYHGLAADHPLRFGLETRASWDSHIPLLHPDDHEETRRVWSICLDTGSAGEVTFRARDAKGAYRWFLSRAEPLRAEDGTLLYWIGINLDVDQRLQAEFYLGQGQRLAHLGSWAFNASGFEHWSPELFRIYGLEPGDRAPSVPEYLALVHPDDRDFVQREIEKMLVRPAGFDFTKRIVRPDGAIRHVRCVGRPSFNGGASPELVGTGIDVTDQENLTKALRKSEELWRDVFENNPISYFLVKPDGTVVAVNPFGAAQFGYTVDELVGDTLLKVVDRSEWAAARDHLAGCLRRVGQSFGRELRGVCKDGSRIWLRETARAVVREEGPIILIACEDITEQKEAARKLEEQEAELRQMLDLAPELIAVFGSERERIFANRRALAYLGTTLDEWRRQSIGHEVHPDDSDQLKALAERSRSDGAACEMEVRLRSSTGRYRWFLARYNPVLDERRRVLRWYVACTDIEDRKVAEDRLQRENVALREEVDETSMFEEIVGASSALTSVLSRVSKVASSDSTVLITGETGTGKELIARAIHKRSRRRTGAFVAVNCAAIPRELIASELFGHEKGAFTGATQRRPGRFELADGGTIFLDEIGELMPDTQVALLRVLQEREFERVGGTQSLSVDIRILAATNRDLSAAVRAGAFRQDLYYRLNVFPVEVPPLRERREDIPVLLEYFVDRYARKAGKTFRRVNKRTLDCLQSYPWPGNVRELQNVVERSVIVCDGDEFKIDESWLSAGPAIESRLALSSTLAAQEKAIIEEALRASGGRVFGPAGAAQRLGMPRSTLESRIRTLQIDKVHFRTRPRH
jgi:PAS domain S-box-containing protein